MTIQDLLQNVAGTLIAKRAISNPTVLNEAFHYTKPSSFSRGIHLDLNDLVILLISGTASIDEHGDSIHIGDIRAQSVKTFQNITALLASEGSTWKDVVRTFRVQTGSPVALVANNTLGNGVSYPLKVANPFTTGGTVQNTGPACATAAKTVTHWFNPCSFANPTSVTAANYNYLPLSSFYGNQGSTTVVGPRYNRVDMSLFKNFATLRESSLQFRADAFNLLNTPAHGQPATNVGGGGGDITNQTRLARSARLPANDSAANSPTPESFSSP